MLRLGDRVGAPAEDHAGVPIQVDLAQRVALDPTALEVALVEPAAAAGTRAYSSSAARSSARVASSRNGFTGETYPSRSTAGDTMADPLGHDERVTGFAHPLVIAHRGVPGLRLEHTRPSYDLAIDDGADYIEPDVVASRDGHLVVRHENEIGSHDRRRRPSRVRRPPHDQDRRRRRRRTAGSPRTSRSAELKTLRAKERIPDVRPGNVALAGTEEILTFDEVVAIAEEGFVRRGTPVGVYVETKHPTYFAGIGLDLNDLLVDALERLGLNHEDAPVIDPVLRVGQPAGLQAPFAALPGPAHVTQGGAGGLRRGRRPAHVRRPDDRRRASRTWPPTPTPSARTRTW